MRPQAKKFFRSVGSDIETEQQAVGADQIEGVPAIKAKLPAMREEAVGIAALSGLRREGRAVRGAGVWRRGLGLVRDGGGRVRGAAARQALRRRRRDAGASDDPADVKRVYRKLWRRNTRIATRTLRRRSSTPSGDELLSDTADRTARRSSLGDKTKRDFRKLG